MKYNPVIARVKRYVFTPASKDDLFRYLKQHHRSLEAADRALGLSTSTLRKVRKRQGIPLTVAERLLSAGINPSRLASTCLICGDSYFTTPETQNGCCAECSHLARGDRIGNDSIQTRAQLVENLHRLRDKHPEIDTLITNLTESPEES